MNPETSRRAFLVLGAESSGTRLLTRLLMAGGCAGDGEDEQRWDTQPPEGPLVVWRRSVPHGGEWPSVRSLIERLASYGYTTHPVVITRDWIATASSQVEVGHVARAAVAHAHLVLANWLIWSGLAEGHTEPPLVVSYEALQSPEYRRAIAWWLKLPHAEAMAEIPVDSMARNRKHYEGTWKTRS